MREYRRLNYSMIHFFPTRNGNFHYVPRSNCDRLDVLVFKVPASQRQNAKMRVDQLKYDIRHLQVSKSAHKASKPFSKRSLNSTGCANVDFHSSSLSFMLSGRPSIVVSKEETARGRN